MKRFMLGVIIGSFALAMASSVHAASLSVAGDLDADVAKARLFKYEGSLYAFGESMTDDSTMSVYQADGNEVTTWTDITVSDNLFTDMAASLVGVDAIRIYKGQFYIFGTNADGVIEVWSKPRIADDAFTEVTTAFDETDEQVTAVIAKRAPERQRLFRQRHPRGTDGRANQLLVFTSAADGAKLYTSSAGESWSQVGTTGLLEDSVMSISAALHREIDGVQYIIVGTDDGRLLRTPITDLEAWEELESWSEVDSSTVTDLQVQRGQLYVAVQNSAGEAQVYVSNRLVSEFTQAGDTGLGNTATESITHLSQFLSNGPLYAATENSTDGAELYRWNGQTEEWVLVDGVEDEGHAAFVNLLSFRGQRYLSTKNTTAGAEVYSLTR